MRKVLAKWLVVVAVAVAMGVALFWGGILPPGPAARDAYREGNAPAEAWGPPPVVPSGNDENTNIDSWVPLEDPP